MHLNSDIKRRKLIKLTKKLSQIHELELMEGKKHTKIRCIHNGKITIIPRHSIINRLTANEIINQLIAMGFTEKQIHNNL